MLNASKLEWNSKIIIQIFYAILDILKLIIYDPIKFDHAITFILKVAN